MAHSRSQASFIDSFEEIFPTEWYLSPSSAHKSVFLLYQKHSLSMPILNGRIGNWILALSEFELKFESAKAIKGQIIADFITEHPDPSIDLLEITPWALFFDGS
jgi:hypothetical protein